MTQWLYTHERWVSLKLHDWEDPRIIQRLFSCSSLWCSPVPQTLGEEECQRAAGRIRNWSIILSSWACLSWNRKSRPRAQHSNHDRKVSGLSLSDTLQFIVKSDSLTEWGYLPHHNNSRCHWIYSIPSAQVFLCTKLQWHTLWKSFEIRGTEYMHLSALSLSSQLDSLLDLTNCERWFFRMWTLSIFLMN
jgi:hypothetical protein